jgi:hypothetical protein
VAGDFNLPNIRWQPDVSDIGLAPISVHSACAQEICDSYSFCGVTQFNGIPNETGSTLDLIFCNFNSISVTDCSTTPLLYCDKYHPALSVELIDFNLEYICDNDMFLDFKSASYGNLNDFFMISIGYF